LSVQSQRGRQAALHALQIERLQLVCGQQGRDCLSLFYGARCRRSEMTRAAFCAAVLVMSGSAIALQVLAAEPVALTPPVQANYMLNCMGCHLADGSGATGKVPSVRDSMLTLARSTAGRRYLVQVPGAALSPLTDLELAQVLSWMVRNLSARTIPSDF